MFVLKPINIFLVYKKKWWLIHDLKNLWIWFLKSIKFWGPQGIKMFMIEIWIVWMWMCLIIRMQLIVGISLANEMSKISPMKIA
jgi:hypothetical protein